MTSLATTLALFEQLISFDTTPGQDAAPVMEWVEGVMKSEGLAIERRYDPAKKTGALLGRLGPRVEGGIVLSGHLDVVSVEGQEWSTPPFALQENNGKLYARGSCDMKGFAACCLSLLPHWKQSGLARPIYIALSTDEETKNDTIHDITALLADEPKPRAVIVGEPTEMNIVTAHKGTHSFFVDITGKAAHSSRPAMGLNAIEIACELMAEIRRMEIEFIASTLNEAFDPPFVTTNLGKIQGGTATNIVAERCALAWHMRQILNAQAQDAERHFRDFVATKERFFQGSTIALRTEDFPPLEPRAKNAARDLAQEIRKEAKTGTAPFATEAGFLQRSGHDVIVCGPGSIEQAHKPNEFVAKDQIEACLDFLKQLPV